MPARAAARCRPAARAARTSDTRRAVTAASSSAARRVRVSATASSTLRPAACTIALPTTMPSASAPTVRACAGVEMPKPTQIGSGQTDAKPRDRRRQRGGELRLHAGDAEPADEVHEPAAVRAISRHALARRRGRDEPHEVERARAEPRLALGIRADRQVGHEHAAARRRRARARARRGPAARIGLR